MEPSRDEGPLLLVREREELARVAHRLSVGGPAFVLIVCAPRLREAVRDVLRAHEPLAALELPTTLDSAEAVLAELTEARSLRSIAVGADAEVVSAVNWHREKVRREGVTLLWLEDVDALERFREVAPDAYSFRDALVIIDGVPVFTIEPPTERPELKLARQRYERAKSSRERVIAGGEYLNALTGSGQWDVALPLARVVASEFSSIVLRQTHGRAELAVAAASIAAALVNGGATIEAHAFARSSIKAFQRARSSVVKDACARMHVCTWDPIAVCSSESIEAAARLVSDLPFPLRLFQPLVPRVRMLQLLERGRAIAAQALSDEVLAASVTPLARTLAQCDAARVGLELGARQQAMSFLREAWFSGALSSPVAAVRTLAQWYLGGAELAAALSMLDATVPSHDSSMDRDLLSMRGEHALLSGEFHFWLDRLERYVTREALGRDEVIYSACLCAMDLHTALRDADRLDPDSVAHWDSLLERAQATLLSYGETDPPWYRVLLPYQRARLLALRPERRDDALTLFREAWELGRERYPEAAPQVAVHLINTLFDAGTLDEIPALLDAAEAVAVIRERLNDQMALCAQRVRYAVLTGASPDTFPPLRARLDALFAESGSLVLKGNTLRALATELPPYTATPDPLALAEEARALFSEMQMPHEEALCVERIGEVLLARGDRAGARQHFQYALQRRRTYGLGMRIPRLERLLASVADAR
ncbi:MAG: hypothetical protein R3A52_06745 [Polyangiales bacterium]